MKCDIYKYIYIYISNYIIFKYKYYYLLNMGCDCTGKGCETTIKILNIFGGLVLVGLSIVRFIFNSQLTNFLQFLLTIYYLYVKYIILYYIKSIWSNYNSN
jgi:hypothetical protein